MNTNCKLTIVIPAYNEESNLIHFIPSLITYCQTNNFKTIIVNDGSKDNTRKILNEFLNTSCLSIINHKLNCGYGGAIKSGILNVATPYVITIDADGQHRFEDVTNLLNRLLETDADMIVGSRKGLKDASFFRFIGKRIIRIIANFLMKIPIFDLNSGMKIYRTDLAKKYLCICPDGMAYSDIITLVFIHNRHLVLEEPILVQERMAGESTIGVITAFQTIMEILNIITLFNPMKIFLSISIILFTAGIGWGMKFFLNHQGISIGSSLLLTISVLVFLLGLIAEQLAAIRKNK